MDLKDLKQHIRTLIALDETASPVISCYLNLESGEPGLSQLPECQGGLRQFCQRRIGRGTCAQFYRRRSGRILKRRLR